jgi:hypothetical protein
MRQERFVHTVHSRIEKLRRYRNRKGELFFAYLGPVPLPTSADTKIIVAPSSLSLKTGTCTKLYMFSGEGEGAGVDQYPTRQKKSVSVLPLYCSMAETITLTERKSTLLAILFNNLGP